MLKTPGVFIKYFYDANDIHCARIISLLIFALVKELKKGEGWMHHLLIYLFNCLSNRMTAFLLCDHFTALYTYNDDNVSASAICYLWRLYFLVQFYKDRPS